MSKRRTSTVDLIHGWWMFSIWWRLYWDSPEASQKSGDWIQC